MTGKGWMGIVGAVGVSLALAAVVDAGGNPQGRRGHQGVAERVQQMKARLGLSDDQAKRIEAILNEASAQGQTDRAQIREHRAKVRDQIQGVLTEEQRAKAAELRNQRRSRRHRDRDQPPPPQS
jgi:periplasmic protein CpxP/Spy